MPAPRRLAPLAFGLALLGVSAAGAVVVIDDLSTNQATISDPPGGASSVATGGADILGGYRDLEVKRLAGAGPVSSGVAGGLASFAVAATTPDSSGLALLTWDGDSDPLTLDASGLGGVDLTSAGAEHGFVLSISAATSGVGLRIEVFTDAGNASQAMRALPAIAAPTQIYIGYSEFLTTLGTGADFADVGAIRLTLYGADGSALTLDRIATGAPTVAALKADFDTTGTALATTSPGSTVRYRVTITNTGTEARTLSLSDVIDPNTTLASSLRSTPIARVDQYQAFADLPFDSAAVGAPALVANDSDPDGNAVAAVPVAGQPTAQGGSVTILADGSFVYAPAAGFVGVDSFPYTLAAVAGDPSEDANDVAIPPAAATAYLLVVPVPPTLTAGGTLAYTENDPATAIDTTLTVTDPDSNVVGATAQITANYANGDDVLSCGAPCAGLSPTFVAGTGTLTLSGPATPAAYQTALRGVRYANSSDDPSTATRTVTWIATDGFEASAPVTSTITVAAVNDPPTLTAGATLAYTENDPATAIDATLTATDPDDTNLEGATAQITANYVNGQDVLSFVDMLGISGVWTPATGTLALTGTSSVANYQTALRSVRYVNTSENPSTSARTLTWIASDGTDSSSPVTSTITVAAVNDPPVAGADAWDTAGNTRLVVDLPALAAPHVRDTTSSTFGVLDNDSDPAEGNAVAVSAIVGCADATPPFGDSPACATANGGSVVMEANGRFTYTPPTGTVADDTFQYVATDDGAPPASANGTVTIHFLERVWYVQNTAAAGGTGRSNDPFDTLVEAQTASSANDWIFVRFGDGTSTGQAAGIVLKNGQHLVGEHAGLLVPADFNGNGTNQVLFAAVPNNRPRIDNSGVGNSAVAATDAIPIEIVGLSLSSANANAIDLTLNPAFAGSGTVTVLNNEIRGAGAEGIDVNAGGTGTLTATISGNFWNLAGTHTGNAIDVARTGGQLRVGLSANSVRSAATGIVVAGGAAASTAVTAFSGNTVDPSTGGNGIVVSNATFDADPNQAGYQQIPGGVTVVGTSGDGVGGVALLLSNVAGDLAFTDLDLFGVAGLGLSGTGAVNVGAGSGMRLSILPAVATIVATNGPGVEVSGATLDLQLAALTISASGSTGVSLTNVADGTTPAVFSAPSGSSIAGAAGTAFNVDGGNANVGYAGTINNIAGRSVAVQNRTGDTVAFTGAINDTGSGILLGGNGGSTITFSGGLTLSTGANDAFVATGGGTVGVTGSANTLATTTGVALNVTNMTIGASGLTFRSISAGTAASGPTNGIVLNNTGASGGLTVTGTGGAGTGGTIRRCGIGISLTSTRNVSLSWMQLNDFSDFAIRGASVVDFSLANSVVNGANGNDGAADEGSIRFSEITGNLSVTSSSISGGFEDNLRVVNTSGALTATLSAVTIGANSLANGNDGVYFETLGAAGATMNVTIQNGFFTSARGDLVQVNNNSNGNFSLLLSGNALSNNHAGIATGGGGVSLFAGTSSTDSFVVQNNTFRDAVGVGVLVVKPTGAGTLGLTFTNNTIGVSGVANSGSLEGSALKVQNAGQGAINALITGNTLRWYNNYGIELLTGGGATAYAGALNATITGNTLTQPGTNPATAGIAKNGIHLNAGTVPGDTYQICLDAGGAGALQNSLSTSGAPNDSNVGGEDIRLRQRQATTVQLRGYAGANNNDAAVAAYLIARNSGDGAPSAITSNTVPTGGGFVNTPGGGACPQP